MHPMVVKYLHRKVEFEKGCLLRLVLWYFGPNKRSLSWPFGCKTHQTMSDQRCLFIIQVGLSAHRGHSAHTMQSAMQLFGRVAVLETHTL